MGNYRWGNYKRLIAEYFPILYFAFCIFWTLTLVRNWMDCKILISECFLTFISRLTAQEGGRLNNRESRFFISFCEHLVFYSATWKVLLCYVELHRTFCEHLVFYSATWKVLLCHVELHRTFCEHRALYSAPWKALQKKNIERCAEKNIKCSAEEGRGGKGFKGISLSLFFSYLGSVFVIDRRWSRIKNFKTFPLWALTDRQKIATRFIVHSLQRYDGHVQE